MEHAFIGPITAQRWRGRRDGKAGQQPEEASKEYMLGWWEGRLERQRDPMTLWRAMNNVNDECDRCGCDHH